MAAYNPSGAGNVHIDQILTNISVAWPNNGLVGERLLPSVTVRKQADKYYIFGREGWLPEDDSRAPGTVANEIAGYTLSTDTYYAREHSLQIPVTDEERENVDSPLAPDRDATELVTSKIMLGREVAIKNLVTTTGNYGSGLSTTLAGGQQWNSANYATSDPISDLRTGKAAVHARIFMEPNTLVVPYQVMTALEDHPDFLERIKYSERAIFSPELLGAVLGFSTVIVPGVGINNANPGATASLGYLWGKDVVMAWVPPRAGLKIPAFGYEFTWGTQYVDRWREEPRKSDLIRASRRYDLKLVAQGDAGSADAGKAIAGYLIKAAIA
jgi:hypothetical protein